MGATTFALNIALNVAVAEELPVLFASSQVKSADLVSRLTASAGRIDRLHLATGQLEDDEWGRLAEAIDSVKSATLYFDDSSPMTIEGLVAHARRLAQHHGVLSLFVVDAFDAVSQMKDDDCLEAGIQQLWQLARELSTVVLLNLHVRRSADTRNDKRPLASDLPRIDALEQLVAAHVFLFRPEHYGLPSEEPGITEVIVANARGGSSGAIKLVYHKRHAMFQNILADAGVAGDA